MFTYTKPLFFLTLLVLSSCSGSGVRSNITVESTPIASGATFSPYSIGEVDTAFKVIGPDHKIEVGAIPDPMVSGVTCFYSRAKTGGITGGLGLATDTSDASVACRQVGDIIFRESIAPAEEIFNERASILFKKIRIVRFYDPTSNSLVYLIYGEKLLEGSPKNSLSAVPLGKVEVKLSK